MGSSNSNQRGYYQMDEVSEARLWRSLDSITERLSNIEFKLSEIVRLEEKVSSHHDTLKRYGDRLDKYDDRIRKLENFQSENNGRTRISGKVIAWMAAAASATITGVITIMASLFIKGH